MDLDPELHMGSSLYQRPEGKSAEDALVCVRRGLLSQSDAEHMLT